MASRDSKRRLSERRSSSRRHINHPFGSSEWKKAVQEMYAFWPKQERRQQERRAVERRDGERRVETRPYNRPMRPVSRPSEKQKLTPEEKRMLNELSQH